MGHERVDPAGFVITVGVVALLRVTFSDSITSHDQHYRLFRSDPVHPTNQRLQLRTLTDPFRANDARGQARGRCPSEPNDPRVPSGAP